MKAGCGADSSGSTAASSARACTHTLAGTRSHQISRTRLSALETPVVRLVPRHLFSTIPISPSVCVCVCWCRRISRARTEYTMRTRRLARARASKRRACAVRACVRVACAHGRRRAARPGASRRASPRGPPTAVSPRNTSRTVALHALPGAPRASRRVSPAAHGPSLRPAESPPPRTGQVSVPPSLPAARVSVRGAPRCAADSDRGPPAGRKTICIYGQLLAESNGA